MGYSRHEYALHLSTIAVGLGAWVAERHGTRRRTGSCGAWISWPAWSRRAMDKQFKQIRSIHALRLQWYWAPWLS